MMPYAIGAGDGGAFAYYGSGAIRRLSNVELKYLRDEVKIKHLSLDPAAVKTAATVSKILFGI